MPVHLYKSLTISFNKCSEILPVGITINGTIEPGSINDGFGTPTTFLDIFWNASEPEKPPQDFLQSKKIFFLFPKALSRKEREFWNLFFMIYRPYIAVELL